MSNVKCQMLKIEEKGFSILETVVALSIITVGILGILSLFTQTVSSGQLSSNQEIATNLAQEGIEVIRNKRDSNWIELKEWNDGISVAGDYKINFKSDNTWEILTSIGFEKLYLKDDKIYIHDSDNGNNPLAIFERKIEISNETAVINEETVVIGIFITSIVQWTEKGSTHFVIMKDNLYNWQ